MRMNVQVVQEYERAVIFRLGRIVAGGAKGPGESASRCSTVNSRIEHRVTEATVRHAAVTAVMGKSRLKVAYSVIGL